MNAIADFEQWALTHEALIRGIVFAFIFVAMMCWEWVAPRRALNLSRVQRWGSNIGLFLLNSLLLRLLFPAAAIGMALAVNARDWGLLNQFVMPGWSEVIIALFILDFSIWLQHWLMHRVPWLWRLHRVHHADLDFDLTTGFRFHTFEIILSMLFKGLIIVLLGPAVIAVLIFEVVLNAMAVFNHSNISLPAPVEPWLRRLVVTPDMHRVHHSIKFSETNSNYGFNLSIWDRVFKTYIDQPESGHDKMTIGLPQFRDPTQVDRLPGMLLLPFVSNHE